MGKVAALFVFFAGLAGLLEAQVASEFADDDAFAATADFKKISGPAPAPMTFFAPQTPWCLSYQPMRGELIYWSPTSTHRLTLECETAFQPVLSDDGRWVACPGATSVRLWRITHSPALKSELMLELPKGYGCELAQDGKFFFWADTEFNWKIYSLDGEKPVETKEELPVKPVDIKPCGEPGMIVVGAFKKTQLWKRGNGKWEAILTLDETTKDIDSDHIELVGPDARYLIEHDLEAKKFVLHWVVDGKLVEPVRVGFDDSAWNLCRNGDRVLVICDDHLSAHVYDVDVNARKLTLRMSKGTPRCGFKGLCMRDGEIITAGDDGMFAWKIGGNSAAKIGGDEILWEEWAGMPDCKTPPQVDWRVKFHAARNDAKEIEVKVSATNNGTRAERQLLVNVACEGEVKTPLRIFLGTAPAGKTVSRTVRLPFTGGGAKKAAVLRLTPVQALVRTWLATTWQYLPMESRNVEEWDALAKKIHEEAHRVLSELTGRKITSEIRRLPDSLIGFMASQEFEGSVVRYMNMWHCSDKSVLEMMELMGVDDVDECFRNIEAMMWSYLCHETVHIARGMAEATWEEEYIANMIQPWLLRRVMEKLKAPYTAQDIERQFEMIASRYRASLPESKVAPIDAFIARDGTGDALVGDPFKLYLTDTGAYIYFGARINAHSRASATTLEKLVEKYLKKEKQDK